MTSVDAARWNERYRGSMESAFEHPRDFLIEQAGYLPDRGLALDVAMGLGGNAGYLLQRGLGVIGLDVSEVGLRQAKTRLPQLMAVAMDATRFCLVGVKFDVILNFYFLQRGIWPIYRRLLKPGGVLIMETLTQDTLQYRPDYNSDYLLAPNELRRAFDDWEILVYREGVRSVEVDSPRVVASLVARASS